jgi:hypothetical protein
MLGSASNFVDPASSLRVLFRSRGGRSAEIAAIDGKLRAWDETRFRTPDRQSDLQFLGNQTCNFAVLAETAQRQHWSQYGADILVRIHVGLGRPGLHGVHGYAARSQVACHTPSKRPQPCRF